ncbi:Neutral amino acid transporter A [Echinococcus granulosus]|nr:Neutral amino acid transporter A [Echinococcus granulosus]
MKQSNVPTMASAIEESNIVLSEKPWRRTSIGCLVNNWFMITTIVSVISGFIVGFCIQQIGLSESGKTWLAMPGTIYIRLLKLTILPMIAANVINVMANLNPKENEKVSGIALGFILIFNLLCSLIGVAYAYIIKSGNWAQSNATKAVSSFGSETGESGGQISYIFKDLLLITPLGQNIELDAAKVVTVVALSVAYVTALPNIPTPRQLPPDWSMTPLDAAKVVTVVRRRKGSERMADSKLPAEEAVYDDEDETVVSERKKRKGFVGCLINNWFMVTTIIGVIIGFGAGFGIQRAGLDETGKTWLAMPGTIYIRLLKLTILPMISANIINVMANLNPKENGKVSAIALGFILVFNLLSALIGVAYSYIINPESLPSVMCMVMSSVSSVDNLLATFRSLPIFVALNIIALFTHLIFALLSLLFLCKNPFSLLRLSLPPYLVGFATTSTIVPLPKCYDVCDTYGIPKPISRFVLPIAGTMKKDASAVFIVAAVFYVAQASNVTLHLDQAVIVIAVPPRCRLICSPMSTSWCST